MSLILFPYLFTRYAGLPVEAFNQLQFPDGNVYPEAWNEARRNTAQCRLALCNLLYELVRQAPEAEQQKALLNLKRAVYNDRRQTENLVQKLLPALQEKTAACRAGLAAARAQEDQLICQWDAVYKKKLAQDRLVVQQLSTEPAFRNGILLSSKDLYQQLPGFVQAAPEALDHKLWRTEFSVLRYLTRMVYKTSPFSTFTYLGLTGFTSQTTATALPPGPVQSRVRLNNKLLKRIKGLMEQHDGLNGLMYIGLNSSIQLEAEQFCYLLNSANIEIFQRLPATPLHCLLYQLLQDRQEPYTLQAICRLLGKQVDAAAPALKSYLLKLVAAGWLELNLQCSEISPDWDEQLQLFLQPHLDRHEAAQKLAGLLQNLQTAKQAFATAVVAERCRLLEQVADQLETTLLLLEQEAGLAKQTPEVRKALQEQILERYRNGAGFEKLPYVSTDYRQEGIFYEDTYTPSTGTVPDAWIRSVTGKLDALCRRLGGFDTRQAERQRMRAFFLQNYAPEEPVSLMQFYQAYYRQKEQLSRNPSTAATEAEPVQQPEWIHAFTTVLEHCSRDEQGIYLSFADLAGLPVATLPVKAGAAFIQVDSSAGTDEPLVVVNSLLPGMGKLSGRFLHLFDPGIGDLQRQYNLAMEPDQLMLELNDGSGFNANIHPPLLNHEIRMPASHTIMEPEQQVPVHRIRVVYDEAAAALLLRDAATGQGIYAYDLCLETLTNRSKLYQLLSHFNPAPYISYYPIVYAIDRYYQQPARNQEITVRPRITYENNIVLRRKGWIVPKTIIPQPSDTEKDSHYYLRIRQWLTGQGLPVQVFLFLQSAYLPKEPAGTSQLTRDDYKPQYICFDQLLLVKLFTRLLQRAGSHIYLEEVLPAVHPVTDPAHRVSEHLLQWYNQ